ncbi:MAG TPA: hypothetical protein VID03_02130 [Acidimicrobiia bacterium]
MLKRLWWFAVGLLAGGWVTARALRRRPAPDELKRAAATSGADLLKWTAKAVRPPTRA